MIRRPTRRNHALYCRLALCLVVLVFSGCSPQARGMYQAAGEPGVTIEFFKDGTWVASGGLSGTFSVDGKRLALRGPLGIGSTGTVARNHVTISFFGEEVTFTKK
jgi:hypothetical protein